MDFELLNKNEDELKAVAWERAKNAHNNSHNPYEQNWDKLKKVQRKYLMEIELNIIIAMKEIVLEQGEEYAKK